MGKTLKVGGPATQAAIEAAYKASQDPHERERLLAIRMGQQGQWTLETIAQVLGRGRDTIVRWVRAYREGGMTRLLKRRYQGRRAQLSEADQQALVEGLRKGQWKSAKEIRRWLQKERGVELKLGGVYYWLNRLEARWKVPRKRHKKKILGRKRSLNARLP
jgi:putative transposase